MTPNQLYKCPPVEVSKDIYGIEHLLDGVHDIPDDTNTRVTLRYYAREEVDHGRSYTIYSVWLDETPVMIIQSAGRGGSDHQASFITNEHAFHEMVLYLRSLTGLDKIDDLYDADQDIVGLDHFYGIPLNLMYNPEGVSPKYVVGDRVIAKVPEDHLVYKFQKEYREIEVLCEIMSVRPFQPTKTYHAKQLTRKSNPEAWKTIPPKGPRYIDCKMGEGNIGAVLNDELILRKAD